MHDHYSPLTMKTLTVFVSCDILACNVGLLFYLGFQVLGLLLEHFDLDAHVRDSLFWQLLLNSGTTAAKHGRKKTHGCIWVCVCWGRVLVRNCNCGRVQ